MTYRQLISTLEIAAKYTDGGLDARCDLEAIGCPVVLPLHNIDKWTFEEINSLRDPWMIGAPWGPVSEEEWNMWKPDSGATEEQIRKLLTDVQYINAYI